MRLVIALVGIVLVMSFSSGFAQPDTLTVTVNQVAPYPWDIAPAYQDCPGSVDPASGPACDYLRGIGDCEWRWGPLTSQGILKIQIYFSINNYGRLWFGLVPASAGPAGAVTLIHEVPYGHRPNEELLAMCHYGGNWTPFNLENLGYPPGSQYYLAVGDKLFNNDSYFIYSMRFIQSSPPVAVEKTTWGRVKAMYL